MNGLRRISEGVHCDCGALMGQVFLFCISYPSLDKTNKKNLMWCILLLDLITPNFGSVYKSVKFNYDRSRYICIILNTLTTYFKIHIFVRIL